MKLNTNSWHYKLWKSSFDIFTPLPESTDLCHYCHRVFWRVIYYAMLVASLIVTVVGGLLLLGLVIYKGYFLHTEIALTITAVITIMITGLVLYVRWFSSDTKPYLEPNTLLGKWLKARKEKVCPLVEFDDE